MKTLIGPFAQILPLSNLSIKGTLHDEQLEIIEKGGIVVEGEEIVAVGEYQSLLQKYPGSEISFIDEPMVLIPGFIDCHTHICYAGSRSRDYAMRIAGKSYLDIARAGGGIWDSVCKTREADIVTLTENTVARANRHLQEGVTTIEVKSGYGLNLDEELKMLRAIQKAGMHTRATLVSTCLAAHMKPRDFDGSAKEYLEWIVTELLPVIELEELTKRVDIFVEQTAFSPEEATWFLQQAIQKGFAATVHADQFSTGGAAVAALVGAGSADHLEASTAAEISLLAKAETVAVVLPGASLGLGMQYAPARKLLNEGACVAIASDWNPGSAPMGDLLMQAAVMSAAEKLSTAEVLAGLTFRAAQALQLKDIGRLQSGYLADLQAYATADYRDILYYQGKMKPTMIWKKGSII